MPQTGYCADVTCNRESTELYECHCCSWLICLKHLLEHVEISKRNKQAQLNTLTNDLISISNTLELIVEKKLHEIEHEKQLINQAKTIIDKSTFTVEEIQLISEEINQAIVSNRKEETIVKVEPSLLDMNTCSYSGEISNETNEDRTELLNLYSSSSSNNILQQPISPIYRVLRRRTNEFEKSTTSKNNDSDVINMNHETIDSLKDEADDTEEQNRENMINGRYPQYKCPLTFDGAFGLTKANHAIELCTIGNNFRQNFIGHLTRKHKLKQVYARRLYEAMKQNQNPITTKLFNENEDVIDHDYRIPCPFSNSMINFIGCCPSETRKIPCSLKSVIGVQLNTHLQRYHHLPTSKAKKITKIYKARFSKMSSLHSNDPVS